MNPAAMDAPDLMSLRPDGICGVDGRAFGPPTLVPIQPLFPPEKETGAVAGSEILRAAAHNAFENDDSLALLHLIIPLVQKCLHTFQHALLRTAEGPHFLHESAAAQPVPAIEGLLDFLSRQNKHDIAWLKLFFSFHGNFVPFWA